MGLGSVLSHVGKVGKFGGRKAGQAINWLAWDPAANTRRSTADLILRLAPDMIFGGMAAAQTPGDIGDKAIAGIGSAVGGGGGGLALGRLGGKHQALSAVLDMAGSIGGDFVGMASSDMAMRGKDKLTGGEGLTPWEKISQEQQYELQADMRRKILAEILGSQGTPTVDPTLLNNGLA